LNNVRLLEELAPPPPPESLPVPAPKVEIPSDAVPDPVLYEALKAWCLARARQNKVQSYMILSKEVMRAIATIRPQTLAELQTIKGIGSNKIELFGEEILDVLKTTPSSSHPLPPSV
jgi:ATP-dependent DNA helicase RecQ